MSKTLLEQALDIPPGVSKFVITTHAQFFVHHKVMRKGVLHEWFVSGHQCFDNVLELASFLDQFEITRTSNNA